MSASIVKTGQLELAGLKPYPGNARTHNLAQIELSLRKNGQYRAIVVRDDGTILAGHGTVEAAERLKWKKLLGHVVRCDDETARRITLVDNRANDLGGYDKGALSALLGEWSGEALEGTGFDDKSKAALIKKFEESAEGAADESWEPKYELLVECKDEQQQSELHERLVSEGFNVKVVMT